MNDFGINCLIIMKIEVLNGGIRLNSDLETEEDNINEKETANIAFDVRNAFGVHLRMYPESRKADGIYRNNFRYGQ